MILSTYAYVHVYLLYLAFSITSLFTPTHQALVNEVLLLHSHLLGLYHALRATLKLTLREEE